MIKRIGLPFHQWEIDRQISVENVEFDEIHFYNKTMERALVTEPFSNIVNVPNILLQSAENINIFVMKDEKVVEHISFGVCPRKQPEDYVYTETEHFTYKRLEDLIKNQIGGYTWHIDTDQVVNSLGEECGTLADCMTDNYNGTWFYAITSTSDAGFASYPTQYTIDGANGYLSLRDYVIWTGSRLVHIPTFEAKASVEKDPATGKYNYLSGVDGLMSSTDKAYLTDLINRFIAAGQKVGKNSGYDCTESGLFGNVSSGRPVSVIDTNTPVGNMMSILDASTKITSNLFLGQTPERDGSLHTDLWFRGDKEATQWLRALTSDNFIRFVNMNYEGYVNWAVAPGIYKVKENSSDGDRAFIEEHTMFVIPGSPEPDAVYLDVAKKEDRVKMREHAITQVAKSDVTGAVRVRYCPIPNINRSVSNKCIGWFDLMPAINNGGTAEIGQGEITAEKIADKAITEDKLADELKNKINSGSGGVSSITVPDYLIVTDNTESIILTKDIKEIIFQTSVVKTVALPSDNWGYWRCVFNLTDATAGVTLGGYGELMVDKTYLVVKGDEVTVCEIDNITRMPIDDELETLLDELETVLTGTSTTTLYEELDSTMTGGDTA